MSVVLRPYRRDDLDRLASIVTDPRVMAAVGGTVARDEVAGLIDLYLAIDAAGAAAETHPRIVLARAAERDGEYVGSGRLVRSEVEPGVLEIGYLVHAEQQGRGAGTAIARELVRIAREELRAPRVIATVDLDNDASMRVLEKAGLVLDRIGRDEDGEFAVYATAKR